MIRHRNTGFTLVELMLSMAFLSMMLLAIAFLVLQISSIYNKGLTLKAVNESGQLIASDIQRTLNSAVPQDVKRAQDITPTGGRLCAGTTVYAWNYGEHLGRSSIFNEYVGGPSEEEIRLVKFQVSADENYCEADASDEYLDIPARATELLAAEGANLAVHTFSVKDGADGMIGERAAGDNTQRLYQVSMTIGTDKDGFINGNDCGQIASRVDDEYCAVNTFEFTARAGNRSIGAAE